MISKKDGHSESFILHQDQHGHAEGFPRATLAFGELPQKNGTAEKVLSIPTSLARTRSSTSINIHSEGRLSKGSLRKMMVKKLTVDKFTGAQFKMALTSCHLAKTTWHSVCE
jgi:hypothetical protein